MLCASFVYWVPTLAGRLWLFSQTRISIVRFVVRSVLVCVCPFYFHVVCVRLRCLDEAESSVSSSVAATSMKPSKGVQFLFIYFYFFIYSFCRPIKPADLSVSFRRHVVTKAHHALVSLNDEWETESVSTGSWLPTCCREQYVLYGMLVSLPIVCSTVARPLQLVYVIARNNKKKQKSNGDEVTTGYAYLRLYF